MNKIIATASIQINAKETRIAKLYILDKVSTVTILPPDVNNLGGGSRYMQRECYLGLEVEKEIDDLVQDEKWRVIDPIPHFILPEMLTGVVDLNVEPRPAMVSVWDFIITKKSPEQMTDHLIAG